ncbi:transferrin-binding protein-like solute binding protein [Martelella radicis]|uniref:Transferrin-binding protein B C-lobe/N-lobe beta-barrel domain-containing protein n=1 Tax=Martelella radicis TaxID=1397476 RepID=A0A7W6KJR7_9HYPH|nr:transferrin-binding protein-like solute binding protein [Martelella radicis]MBB4121175.1 hypothetical protein [Martelella radicis]
MTKTYLKLVSAVALTALVGCSGGGSSGGGIDMGPVGGGDIPTGPSGPAHNAIGYSAVVDESGETIGWQSGDASAMVTPNDDGTVTVRITEGAYAGEERTFTPSSDSGGAGGQATAYMTTYDFDGDPISAFIAARTDADDKFAFYAFRSTEGLTRNMPTSGKAQYQGEHTGLATNSDGTSAAINDLFVASVDFSDATLTGDIYPAYPSGPNREHVYKVVSFDGTINGAEFQSDRGTIAFSEFVTTPGSPTKNIYGRDTSVIDQNTSAVEGAFYGDAAAAMGGTFVIDGQGALEGNHLIGAFKAERGEISQPYSPPSLPPLPEIPPTFPTGG